MKRISQIFTIVLLCGVMFYWCLNNLGSVSAGMEEAQEVIEKREAGEDLSVNEKSQIAFVYVGQEYFENFHHKYDYINLNGWFHKTLGYNQLNKITRLENGYLTELAHLEDVSYPAGQTLQLAEQLEQQGIPFLYVQAPYLISEENPNLPVGLEDYSNANADALLSVLEANGVECLDLRKVLEKGEKDHYEYFFRTDHHWTPEGAFLGYRAVAEKVSEMLQIEVPQACVDRSCYGEREYADFFGSAGKRTGLYYAGTENFTLLYPKFPTSLHLTIPEEGVDRKGDFCQAILEQSHLEAGDPFQCNYYEAYIGGQFGLVQIENELAQNDLKLLIIKDSFALPVQGFLATWFKQIDAIDLRVDDGISVAKYIEETRPDLVMIFYNPYMIGNGEAFFFE